MLYTLNNPRILFSLYLNITTKIIRTYNFSLMTLDTNTAHKYDVCGVCVFTRTKHVLEYIFSFRVISMPTNIILP